MFSTIVAIALASATVVTAHSDAAAQVSDTDILQYALTLEHLEAAFYAEGLSKFSANDFASGGEQYALFRQIADHEATHVKTLEAVLGDKATKACNYSFPYTDVSSFRALAQVLEGVGVSAYLGAAHSLTDPELVTAAGSILTVEARHAAWLATTNGEDPWPGAFDTPLSFDQVYSLAAPFITSCPDSNPKLPVTAFPALTLDNASNGSLKPGQNISLLVPASANATANATYYAAFLNGMSVAFAPYSVNQSLSIPGEVNSTGTVYVVITNSNNSATDDTTIAGPAVLQFNAQYPVNVVPGSSTGNGSGTTGGTGNAPRSAGNMLASAWMTLAAVALGCLMSA